jgi:Cd2+/Zn2+-exporting ATPase
MEAFSEHPIAQSILQKAKEKGLSHHPFEKFEAVAGKGLRGECTVCTDKHHCMGSLRFITEEHSTDEKVLQIVSDFENQGKTTIVMSDHKKIKGVIGVTDEIRPESKSLIAELRASGITCVMLTGDNKASARFVAEEVGIDDVRAELLPDQKVQELSRLLEQYKHVAMVGDGVNDAPALATASVGIAMGAIGSDLAIENADIALMTNNLGILPFLVKLGRKTAGTIRFNIAAAVGVKALFLILAVTGWSSLALAIFADVGMTVLVVANSLRLYRFT